MIQKIGIIGRMLNNPKWNTLFDILKIGVDEGYIEYTKYSLDNGKQYNGSDDNFLIFLATNPKHTDGKEFVQFGISSTEDEIISKMELWAEKISSFSCENKEESVSEKIFDIDAAIHNIEALDDSLTESNISKIPDIDNKSFQELVGVKLEVNNKIICIDKNDAFKLKELIELCKENNFKIVDVIINE